VIKKALRALDGMCLTLKSGGNVPPETLYQTPEPAGMGYGHCDRRSRGLGDWNGAEHADGVKSKRWISAAA
jgi:hypothetical protein